nr:DUF3073 domain-containing protein [Propionibacterium sp.]
MGRGRAKAKQTKVARDLKYRTFDTDFSSLERELRGSSPVDEVEEDEDDDYAEYADRYGDVDDEDVEDADDLGHRRIG